MGPFADGVLDDTTETVEKDGALATVDGKERGVHDSCAYTEAEGGACNVGKKIRGLATHCGGLGLILQRGFRNDG